MTHPLISTVLLALVFLLELASFAPADVAMAAVTGAGLVLWLRGRLPEGLAGGDRPGPLRRLSALPGFVLAVLGDVVLGTWDVALRVMHLRGVQHAGIVAVPIGDRTPHGVAISALVMTLSPGTVFIEVDEERRAMLVHVIDAADPDEVRRRLQDFYERRQRAVFP